MVSVHDSASGKLPQYFSMRTPGASYCLRRIPACSPRVLLSRTPTSRHHLEIELRPCQGVWDGSWGSREGNPGDQAGASQHGLFNPAL